MVKPYNLVVDSEEIEVDEIYKILFTKFMLKLSKKRMQRPCYSSVVGGLNLCGIPVSYCRSLQSSLIVIQDVIRWLEYFLNKKDFFVYKRDIGCIKEVVFIPFSSPFLEKEGARSGLVYLSFDRCSYYFDFLVQICSIANLIEKVNERSNILLKGFRAFDNMMSLKQKQLLPLLKKYPELSSYEIVKAIDNIYEELLKYRRQPLVVRIFALVSHFLPSNKVTKIGLLTVCEFGCLTPKYNQVFAQQLITLYKRIYYEDYFNKYKVLIENNFSKIICVDLRGDSFPFRHSRGKSTLILNFRKKYLVDPYLMVADIIFWTGVAAQKCSLDQGYEGGDILREQFLSELSSLHKKVVDYIPSRNIDSNRCMNDFGNSFVYSHRNDSKNRKRPPRDLKMRNRAGGLGFLNNNKKS